MILIKAYINLKLAQSKAHLRVKELEIFEAESTLIYAGAKLKLSIIGLKISVFSALFPKTVLQGHEMYEREKAGK